MELQGSINHIAITVSDLDSAMKFFRPILEELGYTVGEPSSYQQTRINLNLHKQNGIAFNIWEARLEHPFEVYEPGLHHIAFNAGSAAQVDRISDLVSALGGEILDGPGEFPFAHGGYYAVYFLGPDRLKFEVVYMAELDRM
ncbi:MAG: VOC family protein [Gammaproteobacteria bacterium]|nr:VOC family protein [Pseudomonadales bacterium]MCP5347513.1 VOC family protein [Pseudomonadales bacterium]